jgi:hypothetical protein
MGNCQELSIRRTLMGGVVINARCDSAQFQVRMRMHAEGDFNTQYRMDSEVTMASGSRASHTERAHTEGRYVGPCPAGREPD